MLGSPADVLRAFGELKQPVTGRNGCDILDIQGVLEVEKAISMLVSCWKGVHMAYKGLSKRHLSGRWACLEIVGEGHHPRRWYLGGRPNQGSDQREPSPRLLRQGVETAKRSLSSFHGVFRHFDIFRRVFHSHGS